MSGKKPSRTRTNFRIPTSLMEFARAYADQHNMTVTQLLVDYLTKLKEKEDGKARTR